MSTKLSKAEVDLLNEKYEIRIKKRHSSTIVIVLKIPDDFDISAVNKDGSITSMCDDKQSGKIVKKTDMNHELKEYLKSKINVIKKSTRVDCDWCGYAYEQILDECPYCKTVL